VKCIQYHDGKTVRASNELAQMRVDDGIAVFVSKDEWRRRGAEYEGARESQGRRSINPPVGWDNRSNKKPRWAK
jgi:hypothetical protein